MPELSAFTDDGPWEVDLDDLAWREGAAARRAQLHEDLPAVVRRRFFPPLLRMARATLILGRATLAWSFTARRKGNPASRQDFSRRLARAFQRLGPTYIKLGQVISSGEGLLPDEVVREFRGLRDQVPAESFAHVRRVVESELGRPLDEVFETFEPEPIAAASIAQVHLATLHTGERVAVKVQRPRIERKVRADIAVLVWMAPLLNRVDAVKVVNLPAIVELFAATILEELDFRLEAQNMIDIAQVLDRTGQRAVVVPRPHPTLVTRRVLVMEELRGFAFDDVDGLRAAGVDTSGVVKTCLIMVLEGAMIYGVFHGDLHGGNLLVLPDGRVGLLDYGITGRLDPVRRLAFLRLVMSGVANDQRGIAEAFREMGALPADVDLDTYVAEVVEATLADPAAADGDELVENMRASTALMVRHGMRLPKELMLFMKSMMFMDGASQLLAPDVDIVAQTTEIFGYFAVQHGAQIASEVGIRPDDVTVDLTSMLPGIEPDAESGAVTYRSLRRQREQVSAKLEERRSKGRR